MLRWFSSSGGSNSELTAAFSVSNRPATPSTGTVGTSLTTGGTPHTKTAWTQIFAAASVTADIHRVYLYIYGTSLSTAQTDCLVDIGIGAAASETVLIPNILGGFKAGANLGAIGWVMFPIYIPAGSRISFRAQSLQATKGINIVMQLVGFNTQPPGTFTACDAIGINLAASQGTSVLAGDSGAYGSWTNVGSATARAYGAILPMIQGSMDADTAAVAYEYQVGSGSAALTGSDRWRTLTTAAEIVGNLEPGIPHFGTVASGTQLQIRGTCSGTAEAMDLALYGFYNA